MNLEELNLWCKNGLEIAEYGIVSEKLSGNIVKEEFWKGEACAYRATLGMMQQDAPESVVTQPPPAQTVCSNCICEYCKFDKDTESACGKECGNHFEAFEGRKLLKP